MSGAIERQIAELYGVLQAGDIRRARREVKLLAGKRIPRRALIRFSHVARRSFVPELALRLLNRVVRPADRRRSVATDHEKAEYAALLGRLGAYTEATALLKEIDPAKAPEVLLHRALIHFSQWDWQSAIPLLEQMLAMKEISYYNRAAGRLRLAAAYVHGVQDFERADPILEELRHETAGEHRFLHRDVLLIRAQLSVLAGQPRLGQERLEELRREFLTSDHEYGGYIVRMWRAIAELKDGSLNSEAFVAEMNRVNDAQIRHGWWELSRTCEYYKATHVQNERVLERLYFGSPYEGLRKRLGGLLEGRRILPESYLWHLKRGGRGAGVLDVKTGRNTINGSYLKPGQVPQRVIEALSSDFYRPVRITELFELLYPGEYFNPWSSPVKVRQAIKRVRSWLQGAGLPAGIEELNGYYRLESQVPFAIRVYQKSAIDESVVPIRGDLAEDLAKLLREFEGRPFSVSQAADALEASVRSALRVLNDAVEQNLCERRGKSSATRYILKSEAGSKPLGFDPAS